MNIRRATIAAVFWLFVWTADCKPIGGSHEYLIRYGYLQVPPSTSGAANNILLDEWSIQQAVIDFQAFAGLPLTGELDQDTLDFMELPRCGVRDKAPKRTKRYNIQGSAWGFKNLTYRIVNYPKNLKPKDVDRVIRRALDVWSEHTDLTFTPLGNTTEMADIMIGFAKGNHGDSNPFDGPRGILAHANFPMQGGDVHFDASEDWGIDSLFEIDLFQVAVHEFGHSLGLDHSDVRSSLMAPFYRGHDPSFKLHPDDIKGIQFLYGKKTKKPNVSTTTTIKPTTTSTTIRPTTKAITTTIRPTTTTIRPTTTTIRPTTTITTNDYDVNKLSEEEDILTSSSQEICNDPVIDTIFNSSSGSTIIFKGDKFWKLNPQSMTPPRLISEHWPGLPANISAAFTHKNGRTYFFKGSEYWKYKGTKPDGKYPKKISEGFPGIPDGPEAAAVWKPNGKIYFYKGGKYWKFDPEMRPPVPETYPKLVTKATSSDYQWTNGFLHFDKDTAYYRIDSGMYGVKWCQERLPNFNAMFWIGCKPMVPDKTPVKEEAVNEEDDNIECGGSETEKEPFGNKLPLPPPPTINEESDDMTVIKIPLFFPGQRQTINNGGDTIHFRIHFQ